MVHLCRVDYVMQVHIIVAYYTNILGYVVPQEIRLRGASMPIKLYYAGTYYSSLFLKAYRRQST